jgi:hypothetical protein
LFEENFDEAEAAAITSSTNLEKIALNYRNVLDNSFDSQAVPKKNFTSEQEATNLIDFLTNFC